VTGSATDPGVGNARRRFIAPQRGEVAPACFQHPLFADFAAYQEWMVAPEWPGIDALNAFMPPSGMRFVAQDTALLADGLHYEARIAQGRIATRPQNWHDLFNAMVWARHPAIKKALNLQQCRHIRQMGPSERNRAQQALTQFDETGVIVRVRDQTLIESWDRHDWAGLFQSNAEQWRNGDIAIAAVIGHALMEQMLVPGRLLVGKCLVVQGADDAACIARVAEAISTGEVLAAAAELRPLPLAGIPGWHPVQDADFYAQADYFRPLRDGRQYPAPLS
jgi:hypothetical protein